MKIETIHTLPEMEKVDDGFAYPEKYHNKLFLFKDQFILFREASYDTFPKMIIDTVVKSALEDVTDMLASKLPNKEEILSELDTQLKEMSEDIQKPEPGITEDKVREIVQEEIANSFQNVNRVIENMSDKIAKKVDLEDLQTWRNSIDQGINNLFNEHTNNYPEDSVQNVLGRLDILESASTIDQEKVVAIVHKELSVVKDGMQKMIDEAVKAIQPIEAELDARPDTSGVLPEVTTEFHMPPVKPPKSEKIKFTELAVMKELGFSMTEIAEAKKAGLI